MGQYVFPALGDVPTADVTVDQVLDALRPIWQEKPETASRVRQRMSAVFRSARIRGICDRDPTADIEIILGRPQRHVNNQPALPWRDVPALMREIQEADALAVTRLALEFVALTATRSGEVRGMTWDEISLPDRRWTIPANRMKARRDHRVPLASRAVEIIEAMARRRREGVKLVFPAPRGGQLSNSTLSMLLRRLGYKGQHTPHGFRTSFKTWCTENRICDDLVSEAALAHGDPNAVRAAYLRSDHLEERVEVMQRWARFLSGIAD